MGPIGDDVFGGRELKDVVVGVMTAEESIADHTLNIACCIAGIVSYSS